jgi:hypothetical protein
VRGHILYELTKAPKANSGDQESEQVNDNFFAVSKSSEGEAKKKGIYLEISEIN